AVVYVPILALEGVEGALFRPLALTVIFALLGSTLLSLTVMPALASLALSPRRAGEALVPRALARLYRPCIRAALARRRLVVASAALAVALGALAATRLGTEFVPRLREMAIVINTIRLSSVSLEESVRYGTQIE